MKKSFYIGILIILVALIAWSLHSQGAKSSLPAAQTTVSGNVKLVAMSASIITVTTTDGKDVTLALDPKSMLLDESGNAIALTDIKPGMSIRAEGTTTPTSVIPARITIVSRPPAETDIGDPCPAVITEENSSISCRLAVSSRITLTLPSASYSQGDLSITPSSALTDTFGASTQNDRWVRTFQATQSGKVTISVPSKNKAVSAFKATLDIFDVAPPEGDVSPLDTSTDVSQ